MVADLTLSIRFPIDGLDADRAACAITWQEAIATVDGFHQLESNWDGNGAAPPLPEIVDAAIQWLRQMPQLDGQAIPPTQIRPGTLGEVLFIWQSDSQFIEAEIEQPTTVEWMVKVGEADPEFCSTPIGRAVVLASSELTAVSG